MIIFVIVRVCANVDFFSSKYAKVSPLRTSVFCTTFLQACRCLSYSWKRILFDAECECRDVVKDQFLGGCGVVGAKEPLLYVLVQLISALVRNVRHDV